MGLASAAVFLENEITPRVPLGFQEIGKPSADARTRLIVVLKSQNMEKLTAEMESRSDPRSPIYGNYFTVQQVSEMTKPSVESIAVVVKWLNQYGIRQIEQGGADEILLVTATIAQVERAFGVSMKAYSGPNRVVYLRSMDAYSVPEEVAKHVMVVEGINRLPVRPKRAHESGASASALGSSPTQVTPQTIRKLYRISMPLKNTPVVQAVVSFLEQYWTPSDLESFQKWAGLLVKPIEHLVGYNNPVSPGVEASLDVDYLSGIPEYARTWVWSTNGTIENGNEPWIVFLNDVTTLLKSPPKDFPTVFSMSYQDLEFTVSRPYAIAACQLFQKLTATGITFVTGSGDWGVGCQANQGASCNVFTSDFPSSCPYVTSLGGTYVDFRGKEVSVDFSSGGFSNYFPRPKFQDKVVSDYLHETSIQGLLPMFNQSGRAFPDISTVSTNFQVFCDGVRMPVAGTSAATPTFAAMVTILNDQRVAAGKANMGWINPFLYAAHAASNNAFTDIVSGDVQMGGCCRKSFAPIPGFDAVTGLGSPLFDTLSSFAMNPQLFFQEKK